MVIQDDKGTKDKKYTAENKIRLNPKYGKKSMNCSLNEYFKSFKFKNELMAKDMKPIPAIDHSIK